MDILPPKLELPKLGLGLGNNLDARAAPHPYALLDVEPGLFDFVEYSAPLDVRQARSEATLFASMWERRAQTPVLFHPVHLNLYGPELETPERLAQLDEHARQVGSRWVGNDVGWWHHRGNAFPGYLYIPPPMSEEGLADCVAHAVHVQQHLSVPLLLENPAVFRRDGPLHVLDFMTRLHQKTGCDLVLDLGHLLSFQLTHGRPLREGFDGFAWDAVCELHVAGGVVTARGERRFYVDDHTQPLRSEVWELLDEVAPRCRSLRALTYEGEGHPDGIAAATLQALRKFAPTPTPSTRDPSAEQTVQGAAEVRPVERLRTTPWETFARVYGSQPEEMDREGVEAERDFRRALVAQELDRAWPLSRLLLATEPKALAAFTASDAFRANFEAGEGSTVALAFARYARERIRHERDDAAASVLALETWAQSLVARPSLKEVELLGGKLAPDGRLGLFPLNLEEFLFGARALRRHLTQRAWASGRVETSGLEGLRSLVARARPGPWPVAVRRLQGQLTLWSVPKELWAALQDPTASSPVLRGQMDAAAREGWWRPAPGQAA